MMRTSFVLAFGLIPLFLCAQQNPCQESPFECLTDNIQAARNEQQRLTNFINVPQELKMESKCRTSAENALKAFAEARQWSYYEVDETREAPATIDCNDPRAAMSKTAPAYDSGLKCGIKYPLRPPHEYTIKFLVVVNNDSLAMWRNWRKDTVTKESESLAGEIQNAQQEITENPKLKALFDSLELYSKKSTEFALQSYAQYSRDLAADNKKGIKFYEERRSFLEKKADFFRNKYEAESEKINTGHAAPLNTFFSKNAARDGRYIEGSVVLISFHFNPSQSFSAVDLYHSVSYQGSPYAPPSGARHAFVLGATHFPVNPEAQHYNFEEPSCIGTILFGSWMVKGKVNPYVYSSAYSLNPTTIDNVSVKKIPCDVVQTVEVVVQGRRGYVDKFINGFDFARLSALMR